MIDWTSELEDVACPDDDMKKMDSMCLRFWHSKWEGMEWGNGEQEFRVLILFQADPPGDLTCYQWRVMEKLQHHDGKELESRSRGSFLTCLLVRHTKLVFSSMLMFPSIHTF